ncbi:MAG: DUF1294 domain-containing protein [Firmicutes bacterium]|nr:DUF1294 domain-containing protein [Bacillota bacterium]
MNILWYYLLAVNLLAFFLYGIDKRKAVKDQWRIPEATLLGVAFVGGSIGAWAGMQVFRHKTKHWKFKILVPVFFLMQVAAFLYYTTK